MRIRPWLAWAIALGLLAAAAPTLAQEDDASEAPRPKRRKKKKKSAPAEEQPAKPAAPPPSSGDDDLDLQSTKGGSLDSLPEPSATPRKAKPPREEAPEPSKRHPRDDDAGSEPRKAPADDDSGSEPRKRRTSGDSDSSVEVHKRSSDDEPAPKRKRGSDDEAPAEGGEGRSKHKSDEELGDDERKPRHSSEEGEAEHDKGEGGGYTADWSVVSGTNVGTDQRVVWAELGIPGLSALYLQGRGRALDMGGGLELDFPPLNGSVGKTPRGLSALRLIGSIHYTPFRSPPVLLYLHFDPQWILAFNGIGMVYLPVTFGAGLDLQVVHLALDLGLAPFSANTRVYFPFRTFGVAPPYVGVAGEYPITDQLVATLRLRLQTFPWTAQGLFNNGPVSFFFFGNVSAGVAYRF